MKNIENCEEKVQTETRAIKARNMNRKKYWKEIVTDDRWAWNVEFKTTETHVKSVQMYIMGNWHVKLKWSNDCLNSGEPRAIDLIWSEKL